MYIKQLVNVLFRHAHNCIKKLSTVNNFYCNRQDEDFNALFRKTTFFICIIRYTADVRLN